MIASANVRSRETGKDEDLVEGELWLDEVKWRKVIEEGELMRRRREDTEESKEMKEVEETDHMKEREEAEKNDESEKEDEGDINEDFVGKGAAWELLENLIEILKVQDQWYRSEQTRFEGEIEKLEDKYRILNEELTRFREKEQNERDEIMLLAAKIDGEWVEVEGVEDAEAEDEDGEREGGNGDEVVVTEIPVVAMG